MATFWRGSGCGCGDKAGRTIGWILLLDEGHVNVFKDGLGGNAGYAVGGLDDVVAGAAGLFAAESIDKNEWFGELTGAHKETGAVDGPLAFEGHIFLSLPKGGGPVYVSGLEVSDFDRAWSRLSEYLLQVERLYAEKTSGSIPQELCNGGIPVREFAMLNRDEVSVERDGARRTRGGL